MNRSLRLALLAALLLAAVLPAATNRWEGEISNYLRRDATNPPAKGGILFVGSSTIRMWRTATNDFLPLPVLNRGFGGSSFKDLLFFMDTIVLPYEPKVLVVYEGDNDLGSSNSVAATVVSNAKLFALRVHAALPEAKIFYLSIKPSLKRAARWEEMSKANALIAEWAKTDPRLGTIDIGPLIRGADGEPDPSLFASDGLHLNKDGYARLNAHVRPILEAAYKP